MEMPLKLVLGENANTLVKDVNYELGMMFKKQTTLRSKYRHFFPLILGNVMQLTNLYFPNKSNY